MNIEELEQKYGPLPSTIDRKKMESLLKKSVNPYPLLSEPLQNAVQNWLISRNLRWSVEPIPYNLLDGTERNLCGLWVEGKVMIVLVDDYTKFNKKVVYKGIAGTIHKQLQDAGKRVIWCKKFEWENPRKCTVMQSLILHVLGKTPNRIYARNTVCEIVESKTLTKFFNESSFYGARGASQAVVLKDKKTGEILQAATFGNPYYGRNRYGDKTVECIRSAGLPYSVVVGGMSKLMKFYLDNFGNEINKILFYVDSAHHHSASMDSSGFEFDHFSANGVHNLFTETGNVIPRTPALHGPIKYLQSIGVILGIPDVGNATYVYNVEKSRSA